MHYTNYKQFLCPFSFSTYDLMGNWTRGDGLLQKLDTCTQYQVNLKDVDSACDLQTQIFNRHNIKYYCYEFFDIQQGITLKYGQSEYVTYNGRCGERVYRQAGHLIGAPSRLGGHSGADMRVVSDDYKEKYNQILHWDNVSIHIWDLTEHRTCVNETVDYETYMILRYFLLNNGQTPIGNKDNCHPFLAASKARHNQVKLLEQFNNLFEFEVAPAQYTPLQKFNDLFEAKSA